MKILYFFGFYSLCFFSVWKLSWVDLLTPLSTSINWKKGCRLSDIAVDKNSLLFYWLSMLKSKPIFYMHLYSSQFSHLVLSVCLCVVCQMSELIFAFDFSVSLFVFVKINVDFGFDRSTKLTCQAILINFLILFWKLNLKDGEL